MSKMLKSTGAMGAATLLSRVLGLAREMVYAAFMGDGAVAGAFKMAFTIPNLFRRLLGEGALTAAFIPIFKEKERNGGPGEMWQAANAVISGLVMASSAIIFLVLLGITLFLNWASPENLSGSLLEIAPQLAADSIGSIAPETRLMLELLRVMFPYMLIICLTAIFIGMLNSTGHFFVPALGATVLNLVMIGVVFVVAPLFGSKLHDQVFGLAWGVLVAGLAQAAYQLPTLFSKGYRPRWVNPFNNPVVREVAQKMVPGMLGVAAFQINVLTNTSIAFAMDPQITASFDYAVRLMEFPQGIFAVSLATFLLPALAGLAVDKKYDEFKKTYKDAFSHLVFVNGLAAVLLIVLAEPMIRLLFEYGKFNAQSTSRAAFALVCLAPSLVGFSLVNISARAFYALGDTKTPMRISVVCLVMNILFVVLLLPPFRQGGLGIANTLSSTLNISLLLFALRKKLPKLDMAELRVPCLNMAAGAVVAALVAWASWKGLASISGMPEWIKRPAEVFIPIAAATLAYFGLLKWLGVKEVELFSQMLRARLSRGPKSGDGKKD